MTAPDAADMPDVVVAAAPGVTEVAIVPGEAQPGEEQAPPMPHRRAVASLIVLATTAFLFSTNETSVLGVISVMAEDMNRSEAAVGLMTTVWAVVNMIMSIPAALLLRRLPRKWVLAGTSLLLAVGIAMVASAPSFGWLLAGRGVSGIAHAAFWAIVTPTAAGLFGSAERGRSVSRLLLGTSLAGIVGLPAVTVLAQHVGWRAPYWVLCGAMLAVAVAIVLIMPSFRAEQGTAARGLIPSWPIFARILVVCGLAVASVSLTWTFITPFATDVAGLGKATIPTLLMVGGVSGFVAMFLVGRYLDRYPVRAVAFGMALLAAVWAVMALFGSVAWVLIACVALQGFAWSILVAAMVNWAIRHAPGSTDTANGTYATVFGAGNAAGSAAGAALFAAVGAAWLPVASLVITLGAAVLVWTMRGVGVARPVLKVRAAKVR
ncbi:MFS transporter [Demequina sp.]|uniref:MFS transporter n=1 Tax=Demequina sp. TaxID=2050685 RepID=UPI003D0BA377